MIVQALHRRLDRMLLQPGVALRLALRCSRRLRAWHAWRTGALQDCADALRGLHWLAPPERRVLRNCDDMLALLREPALPYRAARPAATTSRRDDASTPVIQLVLHSCQPLHPSGYGRRSEALIAALHRADVHVMPTLRLGYPVDIGMSESLAKLRLQSSAIDYRRMPGAGLDRLGEQTYIDAYAAALQTACRERGADVIHAASNYLDGLAAAAAGAQLRLPVVYEVRGLWHVTRATREPGYAASQHYAYCETQELRACLAADRVVVLSDAVAEHFVERGVARSRIALVPNAADVVPPVRADIDALRERLALPVGARLFGYAGALVDYEGLPLLIEMLGDARLHDWALVIAGHGAEHELLLRLARQRGVAERVHFTGYLAATDVAALYALLDVCVLPRIDVALTRLVPSQKPYEAIAHGCPVVASTAAAAALEPVLRERIVAVAGRDIATWVDALLQVAAAPRPTTDVPGWDDRAATLRVLYRDLLVP